MSVSSRLLARVRDEAPCVIPPDAVLRSLHPSRSQRNEGAWSWSVFCEDAFAAGAVSVGSQWPMLVCLRADVLKYSREAYGQIHVDPYPPLLHTLVLL